MLFTTPFRDRFIKTNPAVSSQAPRQVTEPEALQIMQDLLYTISGVDPEKVVMEADFIRDLNVDSLGMMEMLLEAEEKFGTEFDIAEAPDLRTVGDLIDLLKQRGGIA